MKPIEQFSLGLVDSEKQTAERMDLSGTKVTTLDGAVLEAQFPVTGAMLRPEKPLRHEEVQELE
jgi:hypothetical protein